MRVLHLYANHKWTGPADLALCLIKGERELGLAPTLAVAGFVHEGMNHAVRERVAALGIDAREGLALRRHLHLPTLFADAARLAGWIDAGGIDVLHTHQPGDHLTAALALARARRKPPLVRSLWEARAPRAMPRALFAFARTSAVFLPFAGAEERIAAGFGLDAREVLVVAPPLDEAVFATVDATRRTALRRALRDELGIGAQTRIVGVTARIQRRRRWELLWEAFAACAQRDPALHLAVLGRPDAGVFDAVCRRPIEQLGIAARVHFLGYRHGDEYWNALRAFDLFALLVPGSDATCRALREAMALGLPCLAGEAAHTASIAGDCALVVALEVESWVRAIGRLAGDTAFAAELGRRASLHARDTWRAAAAARSTSAVYQRLLAR